MDKNVRFRPLCPWEEKKKEAEGASVKRREAQNLEKSNDRCVCQRGSRAAFTSIYTSEHRGSAY